MDRVAKDVEPSTTAARPADVLRRELRAALTEAMRNRDAVAVAALRSVLSAIDNAEARDAAAKTRPTEGSATLAGTVSGIGAGDVERRDLSNAELEQLIEAEITDRDQAAETYRLSGRADMANVLTSQADVLRPYIACHMPPA